MAGFTFNIFGDELVLPGWRSFGLSVKKLRLAYA
jgi:hypothetical protein